MTAMEEDVDDRFAGIDIDSLLNRVERKPYRAGRAKTLYEAPEFVQRLTGEETVLEGQSLCIQTKVRGFPAPTLRWFKDSEEILDHARIVVESDGKGGYCLYINNVNKGDEAAYRCRAENVEGACSCYFFLSVKSKPKNSKKKDTSNRRTVSFPPMFSTIVEKVEEEEKQGKELETLPPSPMTDFYYALTLKGRQTWPTFVGDWAFTKDGHPHKRRTHEDENDSSSTPVSIPNGEHGDKSNLSPGQQKDAARRSLRRSDLAAKKQRLDEEAKEKEQESEKKKEDDEKKKKEEELIKKKVDEVNIDRERKKREDAMKLRRQERAERLERERKAKEEEEERLKNEREGELKEEKRKRDEERIQAERQKAEEEKKKQEAERKRKDDQKKKEEEQKKQEDQRKEAEKRREAEEKKRLEERKKKEEEEQRKREAEKKKKEEELKKRKEAEELERKQREEKEREKKRQEEKQRKQIQEERMKEEERKKKEEEEKKKKEAEKKQLEEKKKKEEERLKLEKDKKDEAQNKIGKPVGQKSVLQKFAKHLDSSQESSALRVAQDKPNRLSPKRFGGEEDAGHIKEKSPIRTGAVSNISQKLQGTFKAQDKPTDIPKPGEKVLFGDKTQSKTPETKTEKDSKLTPWQQKKQDSVKPSDQKTEAQKRLEELNQKDQQRLDELKKQEQKRVEELKNKDKPINDLRRRETQQRETLREKEQKQREELRQKEQQQRENLRQKEQEQLKALRQKEQEQLKALRQKEQALKDEMKTKEPISNKPATLTEKKQAEERLKNQREDLKMKEMKKVEDLKVKEQKQKEEMKKKEQAEKDKLKLQEEKEKEALRLKEEKQKAELRQKQQNQKEDLERKKQEEEKRKRERKEQEELEERRIQYRKEQLRKEQLRRQHEEEAKKKQQRQEEEEKRLREQRERDRQRALQQAEEEEEFQVRVYKRDYSFDDLRKSLEDHMGGKVMTADEHKYWDEILEKHHFSISDVKKMYNAAASESNERQSRMRQRRKSIGEEDIEKMKRSSSITDVREAYTKSLDRPKKKAKEAQKRPVDEEYLKRAPPINDISHQILDKLKKQTEVAKPPAFSGKSAAEITISRLKPESAFSRLEGGRRSKSPSASRHSPSPTPSSTSSQNENTRPSSRTYAELSKITPNVAAKRASFHEMLNQSATEDFDRTDKARKRMSFQGRDAYGSREIPTYKRAANWSDDLDKSMEIKNPDKIKTPDLKRSPNTEKQKTDKPVVKDAENSEREVRPFIYNSARTTARRFTKKD